MDVLLHNLIECLSVRNIFKKKKNYMLTLGLFFTVQHIQFTM